MTLPKGSSRLPSQKGNAQPPKRKSLVGSSSGPPGACMTPSSDMKTAPVSLRIDCLTLGGGLDLGDIDFLHRHHRFKRALRLGRVFVGRQLDQPSRGDLPGEAPFVLAPAALAFLAAILGDRVPVTVSFCLILG